MKEIPLAHNKGIALIDDTDYTMVSRFKWWIEPHKQTSYAVAKKPNGDGTLRMHRLIMSPCEDRLIDHRNRNGLDNRRENLRLCTYPENLRNSPSRGGTSQYKGVSWHKQTGKWCVQLTINGKVRHMGLFIDETNAAIAYNEYAEQYYGEFEWRNDFTTDGPALGAGTLIQVTG